MFIQGYRAPETLQGSPKSHRRLLCSLSSGIERSNAEHEAVTQAGIPNLSAIQGDGVPDGGALLMLVMPGTGKTNIDLTMIVHTPRPRARAYSTPPPEPTTRLRAHFRRFSCRNESPIGKRLLPQMNLDVDTTDPWVVHEVERLTPLRLAADSPGIACLTPRCRGNQRSR